MFAPQYRDRVRDHVVNLARSDRRIVAGAAVGSDATGASDRWSDLDLTFGVRKGAVPHEVLDSWTADLERNFGATALFDLTDRTTLYRVLLLPGMLQVDLSLTEGFAAEHGPRFKLLFGTAVQREYRAPRPAKDAFGYAVHHAVRARFSVERGRLWQAEYWISGTRDEALSLACIRRNLETSHGRGYDRLPPELLARAQEALVRSLDRPELLRALGRAVELLLMEAGEIGDSVSRLEPELRALSLAEWR